MLIGEMLDLRGSDRELENLIGTLNFFVGFYNFCAVLRGKQRLTESIRCGTLYIEVGDSG